MGTETLYVTQQTLASVISQQLAAAGSFVNRGAKKRTDLYFLNNTNKPAVLIEVCFVDSSTDAELYLDYFDAICAAIASGLTGIQVGEPPIEPEEPPVEPPPDLETARVDITIKATGPVIVSINGQDVMTTAPGPELPSEPVFPDNQQNIICTVFGGSADPNDSAYPPYDPITNTEMGVALPGRFAGSTLPLVEVFNPDTGKSAVCTIRDIGPWYIDDYYWQTGTRPKAEPTGSTIQDGKNKGRTSNGAGIDLTPAAAAAVGLEGKGTVHWRFVDDDAVA